MSTEEAALGAVGMIGLGSLGATVFTGLQRAGCHPVACHDQDPAGAASRLVGAEVPFVESPVAVADASETVFVVVYDEEQVRDVLFGEKGVARSAHRPLHVVLLSTVSFQFIRSTSETLAEQGIDLVDCGINGSPGLARGGKTVASIGGSDVAVRAVTPILELIADPTVHMGPVGSGMKAKLVRNMIFYAMWYVGWLGFALGAAAELDQDKLLEVVDSSEKFANGVSFLVRRARAESQESGAGEFEPNLITRTAHKDLTTALELAKPRGLAIPIIGEIERDYDRSQQLPSGNSLLE